MRVAAAAGDGCAPDAAALHVLAPVAPAGATDAVDSVESGSGSAVVVCLAAAAPVVVAGAASDDATILTAAAGGMLLDADGAACTEGIDIIMLAAADGETLLDADDVGGVVNNADANVDGVAVDSETGGTAVVVGVAAALVWTHAPS